MSILVFVDAPKGKIAKAAYEAVYYGKQIADKRSTTVTVLTYGDVADSDLAELGNYGATKVLVNKSIKEDNDEQLTALGAAAVEKEGAKVIIFSFDPLGKSLAPRLSARLEAGLVTGATALPEMDGDNFVVTKSVFSGKAFSKNAIKTDIKIISLMPNSIKAEKGGNTAQVETFEPAVAEGKIKVKELKMDSGDGIPLPEAELVVSAGRGLKAL